MADPRKSQEKSRRMHGFQSVLMILTGAAAVFSMAWYCIFPGSEPVILQKTECEATTQVISINSKTSEGQNDMTSYSSRAHDETASKIPIYLVGAVNKPGIYLVSRGSYLYELIEQAGGLSGSAAVDAINLAMRLDSNQLIRVPTIDEAAANPDLISGTQPDEAGQVRIDLNQADQEQFDRLPGIGPSTALAILEYRKKNGSFRCVEDLMKVPGIKESRFNAIKDLVVVRISS